MTVAGETSTRVTAKKPRVVAISWKSAKIAATDIVQDLKYAAISTATSVKKITSDCAALAVTSRPQEGPIDADCTSFASTL